MGSLILPPSGTVYLDAQCIIYSVEKHPNYSPVLDPLWLALKAGGLAVVSSELTLLETLVVPTRRADVNLVAAYEQLFRSPGVHLLPITRPILREAARLRAVLSPLRLWMPSTPRQDCSQP